MSKLLNEVKAQLTGHRKALHQLPMVSATLDRDKAPNLDFRDAYEYEIQVVFGAKVYCQPEELTTMIKNVMRQLQRDVYDDFIQLLLELEREVHENTMLTPRMRELFQKLHEETGFE